MFDPAGRFRGYSGGARDAFAVGREWATPGYLPAELPAGEWRVLLGLHRVPTAGLPFEVRATIEPVLPPVQPGPPAIRERPPRRRDLPTVDGLVWLAGDLHAHTVHSDGVLTIEELAAEGTAAGLDFLAVTDHNTVSHHPYLGMVGDSYGITLVPGQEVTTYRGHANAFGDIGWVDFRRPAADWVSTVATRGGLLSINHPLAADCAWLHPLPTRPPLAEVWHSGWWDRTWSAPLAWLQAWDPGTVPVGGSDFHGDERLGRPTTWVLAADPSAILDGLAAGRTAISESPDGPLLLRVGDELVALGADGLILTRLDGGRHVVRGSRYTRAADPGLHWLEDDRAQIRAITS